MLKAGCKEYDINWDKESGNGCDLPDIWSVGLTVKIHRKLTERQR